MMEDIIRMKWCNTYRHVIQCNLKGPGADKLGLNGCGREGYKKGHEKLERELPLKRKKVIMQA